MAEIIEFSTERLRLRQWAPQDREPFAAMNADPEVMKYFASVGTREGSFRTIDVWQSELEERGWSNWAVEHVESRAFIGFVGLSVPRRALPFMPCVEVGWRLARSYWGKGERLNLDEVVSFTSVINWPSRAVMKRIGMVNTSEDFDHPALPEGSELRRHCLYKITLTARRNSARSARLAAYQPSASNSPSTTIARRYCAIASPATLTPKRLRPSTSPPKPRALSTDFSPRTGFQLTADAPEERRAHDPQPIEGRERLVGRSSQRERDHLHGDPLQPQLLGDQEPVRSVDHPAVPEDPERCPDPVLGDVLTEHAPLVRFVEVGRPDEARLVERQRGQSAGVRRQGSGEAEQIVRHHGKWSTSPVGVRGPRSVDRWNQGP